MAVQRIPTAALTGELLSPCKFLVMVLWPSWPDCCADEVDVTGMKA